MYTFSLEKLVLIIWYSSGHLSQSNEYQECKSLDYTRTWCCRCFHRYQGESHIVYVCAIYEYVLYLFSLYMYMFVFISINYCSRIHIHMHKRTATAENKTTGEADQSEEGCVQQNLFVTKKNSKYKKNNMNNLQLFFSFTTQYVCNCHT